LDITDLGAPLIGAFLKYLQTARANTVATRNARLAAIHSLFRYAALQAPEHAALISRVLAIPPTRNDRAIVSFLTADEIDALLAAPDRATWHGRRDHALLLLACQTGLRVSELTRLTRADIHLGAGPAVRCHGKGRKDRATPLTKQTVTALRAWLDEHNAEPTDPLFPPTPATDCPTTRSNASSPNTPPPPPRPPAPPSPRRTSPRTPCGTPPRWPYSTRVWTPRSSLYGLVAPRGAALYRPRSGQR